MCLIVIGWRVNPDYPLVVAANRDEFHARPTARADFWADSPEVIAGRDLEAGGTWLGIARDGRFAAVTNVREAAVAKGLRSRGSLTRDFLVGRHRAADYVGEIDRAGFSGFNLLVSDNDGSDERSGDRPSSPGDPDPGGTGVSGAQPGCQRRFC